MDESALDTELGRLLSGHVRVLLASADRPGISLIDLAILRLLAERGAARASCLAEEFSVTRTSVSRHIALLADAGMIDQITDPDDGRAVLLTLTASGRQALAADAERRRMIVEHLTEGWSDQERRTAARLLNRLNDRGEEFLDRRNDAGRAVR